MSTRPDKLSTISYGLFVLIFTLIGWQHLATALATVLFAYLALNKLCFRGNKVLAVGLFVILIAGLFYGFILFINHAIVALPAIISISIPVVVRYATEHGIELPFTDIDSLKAVALDNVREAIQYLGNFAKVATKESVILVVGVVVAIGIFVNGRWEYRPDEKFTLYTALCGKISGLFASFYESFERVMGAQVIISAINTALTAIFITACSLPYTGFVIILTFFCGLFPVIGNLVSNTVIVGLAFTISPEFAGGALIFLIVIHKLEYFLNSKIIGSRIQHPMWLTLLALVLFERLLGVVGLMLAGVFLNFIKVELSKFPAPGSVDDPPVN